MAGFDGEAAGSVTSVEGGATLGVAEALAVASGAISAAAPELLWVQGEVEGLTRSRAGH